MKLNIKLFDKWDEETFSGTIEADQDHPFEDGHNDHDWIVAEINDMFANQKSVHKIEITRQHSEISMADIEACCRQDGSK